MTRPGLRRSWLAACGIALVAAAACTGASADPGAVGSGATSATVTGSGAGPARGEARGAEPAAESDAADAEPASAAGPAVGDAADTGSAAAGSTGSGSDAAGASAASPRRSTGAGSPAGSTGAGSATTANRPAAAAALATSAVTSTLPGVPRLPGTPTPHLGALLGAMGALVGASAEPGHLAEWTRRIDGGQAALDGYIDEIIATERFAAEVMPSLLFATFVNVRNYYALPFAFVLKRSPAGPLYLRAPCSTDEAVTVTPWWDLRAEVQVCPDSYRPTKWTLAPGEHSYRTQMALSCDSQVGSPEQETSSLCGCGPNLIRCLRDEEQYNEFNRSFMDEIKQTTAYVVEHDLPMATLFTGNATFRDRNVELYYRRQKISTLEIARARHELSSLRSWPQGGKWAPREEVRAGQHAGVLTAPQILHWLPDRRQRQRGYYEVMWCNLRNSFGATTHKVLEINANGNNFFVHDSWKRLAHTELCMNCHARLDYGSQFFLGYPDSRAGTHYNPALAATGKGPLYGRDLRDLRGQAPLTPVGFARLATEQPDFNSCMANHFVNYVLGDRATNDDIEAIQAAVDRTRNFKAAMKVALGRYARRWREEQARPIPAAAASAAPNPSGMPTPAAIPASQAPRGETAPVTVTRALRAKLDAHCVDCHDEVPYTDNADSNDLPFDLTGGALARSLVVSMTDHVAFGMMPKDQVLDPEVREDFVGVLIDTLWTDPAARDEARSHYLGRARGLPAQQIDNALSTIDQVAHAPSGLALGALERGIWSDQATMTPGFLAITGLVALRACARATTIEAQDITLDQCLARATSVQTLSRWPAPSPPATP